MLAGGFFIGKLVVITRLGIQKLAAKASFVVMVTCSEVGFLLVSLPGSPSCSCAVCLGFCAVAALVGSRRWSSISPKVSGARCFRWQYGHRRYGPAGARLVSRHRGCWYLVFMGIVRRSIVRGLVFLILWNQAALGMVGMVGMVFRPFREMMFFYVR